MALSINLRSFTKSNQLVNRFVRSAVVKYSSAEPNFYTYNRDPAANFFNPEVQKLLKSVTRLQLEKIFRRKAVKNNAVEYKFMTAKQLEEEVRHKVKHAEKLLQMPPIIKIMDGANRVITTDKALKGFSKSSFVFTDVTFGLKNKDRSVVIRHPDGVLENASFDIRKRVYQIYFRQKGRLFREPKMFEAENIKRLLAAEKFEFILDRLCLQYEPDEQIFHQITAQVFQHINDSQKFDDLRSTRHFGPMAFFLAWHKLIDNLLIDMIRNDYLKNAAELVCLMFKLNNIKADTSILKQLEKTDETEKFIEKTLKSLLSKATVPTIDKSEADLREDELCFNFIQESYVNQHSLKKGQLELTLQTYKERHNELKKIAEGVN